MNYKWENLFTATKPKNFYHPNPLIEIYESIPDTRKGMENQNLYLRSVVKGKITETGFNLSGRPYIDPASLEHISEAFLTEEERTSGEISYEHIVENEKQLNQKRVKKEKTLVKE